MTKIDERIIYIIIGIIFINLFITLWENISNLETMLILLSIVIGLMIYTEIFLVRNKDKILLFSILTTLSISMIVYINLYGTGMSIRNFYFIVLFQIFRVYRKYISIIIYSCITLLHLFLSTYHLKNTRLIIETISRELAIFSLNMVIIMLMISLMKQNEKLENMQSELTLKKLDIERTHNRLLKAYNQLEVLTIIKERNQIARDMHDTVGHTLTTALIELELGKMMVEKKEKGVSQKLKGAIELVRKGLQDLRTSVKTLKDNIDYMKEIKDLIDHTITHTDIKIRYQLDKELNNLPQKVLSCIYRIIQEGITNGIKHGQATSFLLNVLVNKKSLILTLDNNGHGMTIFNKGFGLNAMEERVKELNGSISFEYGAKNGFGIHVSIPL